MKHKTGDILTDEQLKDIIQYPPRIKTTELNTKHGDKYTVLMPHLEFDIRGEVIELFFDSHTDWGHFTTPRIPGPRLAYIDLLMKLEE